MQSKPNSLVAKLPPQNIEAEQSLLGALLIDKDAILKVSEFLLPDHFYRTEQHGHIYNAIVQLFEKRDPIDLITVADKLKQNNSLDLVGGTAYLAELVNMVPTSAHVESYAKIIKEHAVRRQLIANSTRFIANAYDETQDLHDIIENAEQAVFSVSQQNVKRDFIQIKDALAQSFDRLDELQKNSGRLRGVPTGFRDLDNKLAGFQDSNLIIFAARPGMGKTSFALNIAQHVAVSVGLPVGIFSLEMSQEELVDRLLVAQADIDAWKLKTGHLDDRDFDKLSHAMGQLAEARLFIDDTPGSSISEIRTKARRLQMEQGLKLLIVDYLQLIHGRNLENRVQEVSEISQGLKNLARELKVPVLAISQLSRAVEARGSRKPQLADLRESGCLAGETLIMRADTGQLVAIKDLVGQTNIPVLSIGPNLKLVTKNISRVFSSGLKQLYEIRTSSGRTIKASANHPFLTIAGWHRVDQLEIGTHLGLPRAINLPTNPTPVSEESLILLAHLIGDGCVLPRQPIHYTSADLENIDAVAKAATKLFHIQPRLVRQKNWFHLYLPSPYRVARGQSHPIIEWFKNLGLRPVRSYEKVLPKSLFSLSTDQIGLFLHRLWSTDGNISWKLLAGRKSAAAIYYSTTSQRLAIQVQHLLLRLGILSTLRTKPEKTGRPSFLVHIQGASMQQRFCQLVGSYGARGKIIPSLRSALSQITPNPNLDIIPRQAWNLLIKPVKDARHLGWRDVSKSINTAYCGSTLFRSGLSRERLARVATALTSPMLFNFAHSDIYWDQIVSITPLEVEEVFDATVPETHNFVANDFIVHNSIEQDADVVMFIYREDPDNPDQIKLDIQKHRNGPTGEIDLIFRGDRTKFYGMEKARSRPTAAPKEDSTPKAAAT